MTNENLMYPSPALIGAEPLYLLKSGSHYDPLHSIIPTSPEVVESVCLSSCHDDSQFPLSAVSEES